MNMYRSTCVVSNCRTHESILGIPEILKTERPHYNCTPAHPCLECLKCPDCKSGRLNHSSVHAAWTPGPRKQRVVLTEEQKQEIKSLAQSGASNQDLACQFKADISTVRKILQNP